MEKVLMITGLLFVVLAIASKLTYKIGIPTPLIFLSIGLVIGNDVLDLIPVHNINLVQYLSTFALMFIMFYGGFGVNLEKAKPVLGRAIALSSIGTLFTAFVVTGLMVLILKISWLEGFLIGAVIASTDAASVFSILKSKKLGLKEGMDSLLEIESGSNDPFAYMLTILGISLINHTHDIAIPLFIFKQLFFGAVVAICITYLLTRLIEWIKLELDGLYSIFIFGIVLLTYTLSHKLGGNGFLSVYIAGIILNNSRKMPYKRSLVHFFDGVSWMMQMILFLSLGILAIPAEFIHHIWPSLILMIVLTVVARPLTVFILTIKSKFSLKEKVFISFAGIRGAASIVFSTYVLSAGVAIGENIFYITFFIVLLSVLFQGGFLPKMAKKLDLIDNKENIEKTFSDYENEVTANLAEITLDENSAWLDQPLNDIVFPGEARVIMIKRDDHIVIPNGETELKGHDTVVFACQDACSLELGKKR